MRARSTVDDPTPSYVFHKSDLHELLEERAGPCVSIYFPSHRRKTEARSDSILYRNLCREVEKILLRDAESGPAREIAGKLKAIDEPEFWEHGSEGVAVFAAPGFLRCYRLPMTCPQLEVVGGSFHTKPLIRYLHSGDAYQVLSVGLQHVELLEGWGDDLQRVPLPGVPRSLEAVVGDAEPSTGTQDRAPIGGSDDGPQRTAELERYFREVGRALQRTVLKNSHKPLILAASAQQQPLFRRASPLAGLLDAGIHQDVSRADVDEIRARAREILQPLFDARLEKNKEAVVHAVAKGHGSDRLLPVARAAAEGRVKQLIVESGRRFWGLLNRQTGDVLPGDSHKNAYDVDVYDELAEMTFQQGGEVLVLDKERMPGSTGIAAIFRY